MITPPRNGNEQLRLASQYQAFNEIVGLLPAKLDVTNAQQALDLLCGGGNWCLDIARTYDIRCVGIDVDEMVNIAQVHAHLAGLNDFVMFEGMKGTLRLPFLDGTFDVVHAQDLSLVLPREQWPSMLKECFRVLKEDGYLVLAENLLPTVNGPVAKQMTQRIRRACWDSGFCLCEEETIVDVSRVLLHHMKTTFRECYIEAYLLENQYFIARNLWQIAVNWQPFLTYMGQGSQEEIYHLCDQFTFEGYEGLGDAESWTIRAWGRKQTQPLPTKLPLLLPHLSKG